MKSILALFLILLTCSTCSYAEQPLNHNSSSNQKELHQVQKMLSNVNKLSGKFKQTQKIQLLSTPLISSGHFILSKTDGLKWHQTNPFKSNLTLTTSKIEQQLADNPPTIITKEQQPIVFSFTNIFLSVFNGDTKTITEHFAISFTGNTTKWNILLKPIGAPLNKAIASIELSGSKYINFITINEARNNKMVIQLYNIKEH